METHIVWYKRDLRISDHQPLWEASQRGVVLPLYVVDPVVVKSAEFHPSHWTFIQSCLTALRDQLAQLGQPLIVRIGNPRSVFQALSRQLTIAHIWSHQEIGNHITSERNCAVQQWAETQSIPFTAIAQDGIEIGLSNREGWAQRWQKTMRTKLVATPEALQPLTIQVGRIPTHQQLKIPKDRRKRLPDGGSVAATNLLAACLQAHAATQSHLSPHLTYGTISVRQVVQAVRQQRRQHDAPFANTLLLRCFQRCHTIQKLASDPTIEQEEIAPEFAILRQPSNRTHLTAWQRGKTGVPLVDAAVRAVMATGLLEERLRRLIVSFAIHNLRIDWREVAQNMAFWSLDYEPGILYPTVQQIAGTGGIYPLRIVDPTRATAQDYAFIRQWVSELAYVPDQFLLDPWRMGSLLQKELDLAYPKPLVDYQRTAESARKRWRRVSAETTPILTRHALPQPKSARSEIGRLITTINKIEFGLNLTY